MPQKANQETDVMKTWKEIWSGIEKGTNLAPEKDLLSSMVFKTMMQISRRIRDQSFLEAGSGLGFASLKICLSKGKVILLDIDSNILRVSHRFFFQRGLLDSAYFVAGTVSHLPFRDDLFDVVWNSGVLEHFNILKQREFIHEMVRVLKPRGILAVIVPNKDAFVYNVSRVLRRKMGCWSYGYEEPLTREQLEEVIEAHVASCETVGFAFSWQFKFLPGSGRALILSKKVLGMIATFFEIVLAKLLGHYPQLEGYLIAGYGVKKTARRARFNEY
ncbi:MAG: class I SAM-dependent methyltransferase [Candidatus Hodarchaeota archaeon]